MNRRLIVAIGALILSVIAPVAPAAAASSTASLEVLQCAGTISNRSTPGLLLFPRPVNFSTHAVYAPCVSTTDPTLTTGGYSVAGSAELGCLDLFGSSHGTLPLSWNNGQTSDFEFTMTIEIVGGQAVSTRTGRIIAGEFTGDTAVVVGTFASLNVLDCLAEPGVTDHAGTSTVTITRL